MKVSKYLLIALTAVISLALLGWVLRNSIIERISGPILAEYGLSITDVSLDALATENATISYLELKHENGTTFSINKLNLPIRSSAKGSRRFSASRITVGIPETSDPEPLALAQMISQILALPLAVANTEVRVAELLISPYPAIHDVLWSTLELDQSLSASVGATDLAIVINEAGDSSHEITLALNNNSEKSLQARLVSSDSAISLTGNTSIDLRSLPSLIPDVSSSSGIAAFQFNGHIPRDEGESASFEATMTISMPADFSLSITPGENLSVSLRSASALKLGTSYPGNAWSVNAGKASFNMSYSQWKNMSVSLGSLACSKGPDCLMNLQLTMDDADLGFATAGRLEYSASQQLVVDANAGKMLIRPGANLSLQEIDVSDTKIVALTGHLRSAAMLEFSTSGWQMTADSLDANIDRFALDDDLRFSAPASLAKLLASDSGGIISVKTSVDSPFGELNDGRERISLPGFSGNVSLQGDDLVADLTTFGLYAEASIVARHDLGTDTGRVAIENATLSFDAQKLSDRVSPWNRDWNVRAGTVSFDLRLNWQKSNDDWQLNGQGQTDLNRLAGFYGDTVFTGLTTTLSSSYGTASGFTLQPASIQVGLLEIGLPIENISADILMNPNELSVDVKNLRMHAFGGVVVADPFLYELNKERNELVLHAESLDLTELLTLKEFEAIELTGSIGAELPVTIEGGNISIVGGTLTGDSPGGVIRYQAGIVPGDDGTSAMGIVTKALSNFEYETLDSTVAYSKDGDLKLQMRIAGRNPDLKDNRPVILNLGVENNVPQMLRSLQAARAVEDILEKRIKSK